MAAVPDARLDGLAEMYEPRKPVSAMVSYVDIPPPATPSGRTRGISGQSLNDLQRVDALLIVARAFQDEAVLHIDGSVDPFRDVENMMLELLFSDLELLWSVACSASTRVSREPRLRSETSSTRSITCSNG